MGEPAGQLVDHALGIRPGVYTDIIALESANERLGHAIRLRQVEAILGGLEILPLDVPADAEYGGIRAELEAAGKPIGANELLIAAHAYALDRGRFVWPATATGTVALTSAQMSMLLEGIDWRRPERT